MIIAVNGTDREIAADTTLRELLADQQGHTRGRAVVVDGEVIARSQWEGYRLRSGQHVELITATQGG